MLDAQEAPAGQMEVVLAPGDSGILLHEAVGHGLEADFNRKGTSNYSGKRRRRRSRATCAPWSTTRRSLQSRGTINVDDEGNEPTRHAAHREGQARRLHARPPERPALRHQTERQRTARELRVRADAADDQHHPARGSARAGGDPAERQARGLREEVRRRAGRHRQRRLRLLADRELPRRGRQDHRAAQGREPHRQRARRAPPA